jgi:hypothetical protein
MTMQVQRQKESLRQKTHLFSALLPNSLHSSWTLVTDSRVVCIGYVLMILPQVHLRKPCYDFYFL